MTGQYRLSHTRGTVDRKRKTVFIQPILNDVYIGISTSRKVGRPFDICGRKVSKSLGPQVIWYADEDRCIGEMLPKSRTYQIACPISFRFRSSWTTEKFECESRQRSLRQKEKLLEPDIQGSY